LIARIRKLTSDLKDTFWLIPGLMVFAGLVLAVLMVKLDRYGIPPSWLSDGSWLYTGGATGARTLLGAVASSTIGVAGTVFSITIAALSLAAGQMGPRLMSNFTRDRGNQFTLGAFLGTFSYALMVLRSVRTPDEGNFVPHLALTFGIVLALLCVATLVYFVGHMASRISVDTVIDLVSEDVRAAIQRLTVDEEQPQPPGEAYWRGAVPVADQRHGYLQQLDEQGLADWAHEHKTAIRLLVRPGHYVFPGAPIAVTRSPVEDADAAIRNATALGAKRAGSVDLEFAIRQLVEVAVRALSPGINDPHTALSVLDRLGTALCDIVPLHLPTGVVKRDGEVVVVVPSIDYEGLAATMFNMIRQNAPGNPAVLIRLLQLLSAVARVEREPRRLDVLQKHAALVLEDAERGISNSADIADVRRTYERFEDTRNSSCVAIG
jgi:uncharacterized membrane protein